MSQSDINSPSEGRSSLSALKAKTSVEKDKSSGLEGLSIRNVEELKKRGLEPLSFTFEDFDRSHEYFNLSRVGSEWFILLLDTIKKLSNYPWPKILKMDYYDSHPHDWNETNAKFNKEKYEQYEGVQFALGPNQGRVHGYVIGNLFFVVWLDKYHNLYDMDGYPPVKSKIKQLQLPGKSCLQIIDENISHLTKINRDLELQNNKLKEDFSYFQKSYDEMEAQLANYKTKIKLYEDKDNELKNKKDKYNKKMKKRHGK